MSRLDTLPAGAQEWRLGMGNASTSPGLPSDFTRVGYTSGDEQYPNSALSVDVGRAAGSYYYTTAPADFTAYLKASVLSAGCMFGLLAIDSSGNGVGAGIYNSAPNSGIVGFVAAGAYNSSGFANTKGLLGPAYSAGAKVWVKLNKTGNVYKTAASVNGDYWTPWSPTITDSSRTISRVGFGSFFGTPDAFVVETFGVA